MQADGELNPSAEPVELPDPSDSGPSYWQARTIWALGEGYAAFRRQRPGVRRASCRTGCGWRCGALERQVLDRYGRYRIADGRRVPAWLIVNGADATAEAVLGLSAYVDAAPGDRRARRALRQFARRHRRDVAGRPRLVALRGDPAVGGVAVDLARLGLADVGGAGPGRGRPGPAAAAAPGGPEVVSFDPTLITAGGPDNGWLPTPIDRVQIAYGVDSRVQSLLAVAEVGRLARRLEIWPVMEAAWFFGANRAGEPMYDPATGVTFDGVEADGRINRNSGAESTIHGLLTMLALDDHPAVRARARV